MQSTDAGDGVVSRIRRSPAISPSRPLSIRHRSAEQDTYIDMYGLNHGSYNNADNFETGPSFNVDHNVGQDFLTTNDVAQELKNLRTLRRLSLDGAKLDPDVPPQNYEVAPTIKKGHDEEDSIGNSLYWVPARIHPELAPQEWQSFVQKTGGHVEESFDSLLRSPSIKRGLTRSKSLLSREVNEKSADHYTDAGPELERRRSKLRPRIKVADLENLTNGHTSSQLSASPHNLSYTSIAEETSPSSAFDEPILVPPPGQILRRAARTDKGRGSYRKLGPKPTSSAQPEQVDDDHKLPKITPALPHRFESETIQLRDDAPRDTRTGSVVQDVLAQSIPVERKKSKNRTIQVVGPKSPSTLQPEVQEGFTGPDWPLKSVLISDANEAVRPIEVADSSAPTLLVAPVNPDISVKDSTRSLVDSVGSPEGNKSTRDQVHDHGPPDVTEAERSSKQSVHEQSSRPGLKREMSASSLTRAVMNGTAPVPSSTAKSPPRRHAEEYETEPTAVSNVGHTTNTSSPGKKSAWGKLFSHEDKDKGKAKKEVKPSTKMKRVLSQEDRTQTEKDNSSTNLFTSIFGGKKKDKEVTIESPRRVTTPTPATTVRHPQYYCRYPIQLERAIYRMAHLKLSNSRRPLAHQVLLSNFMYGYLRMVGVNTNTSAQGPSARSKSHDERQRKSLQQQQRGGHSGADNSRSHSAQNNTSKTGSQEMHPSTPPGHANAAQSAVGVTEEQQTALNDSHQESNRQQRSEQGRRPGSVDVAR